MVRRRGVNKTKVRVSLDKALLAWVDEAGEGGRFSRSDVIGECIRAAREQEKSEAYRPGKHVEEVSGETEQVLVSVADAHLAWIDGIVEQADVSRSEVVSEVLLRSRTAAGFLREIALTEVRRRRIARAIVLEDAPTLEEDVSPLEEDAPPLEEDAPPLEEDEAVEDSSGVADWEAWNT